jgi:hypothetical protein
MATIWLFSGTNATGGLEELSVTSGTITSATDRFAVGTRALKIASGGNARKNDILADAGRRMTFPYEFDATPSANSSIVQLYDSGLTSRLNLRMQTTRVLQFSNFDNSSTVNGTTVLVADTTYRISVSYVRVNGTNWSAKVWLDGVLEISASNANFQTLNAPLHLVLSTPNGANSWWGCGYVDDGTGVDDVGEVLAASQKPDETNTGNFDTTGGTGAVNEVPLSETNYKQHAAATDVQQNYTLQTVAEGTDDLTGATLVARTAWAWAKRGAITPVTHRASAAGNGTNPTTSDTITIPAGTATGESLFVYVTSRDHTSATGYVSVTDDDSGGNAWARSSENPDASRKSTLWWKRATAATASKTITITGAVGSITCGVSVFSGAATSVVPYTNIVAEDNASANETHAGFTPDIAGSALCFAVSNYNNDNAVSNVAGATIGSFGADGGRYQKLSTGGSDCANTLYAIDGTDVTPPATGAITWSQTNGVSTSISWAVRPEGTPSPDLMDNGSETAITLSATSALYTLLTDSASYPSNAAGIGLRSTGTAADTFLYECGTVIAYIPTVSNPVTATPGAGTLTLTGFAPTVLAPRLAIPDAGSLTLTGLAPVAQLGIRAYPGAGAPTLTSFAPTVATTAHVTAAPGAGALTLTGFAPTVVIPVAVTPGAGTLTLTGLAPTVLAPRLVLPGAGALTLTGLAPTVLAPRLVAPEAGELTLTGLEPTVKVGVNAQPGAGSLALTGFAPTVLATAHVVALPGAGSLTLAAFAPTVVTTANALTHPGAGALTLTGFTPTVTTTANVFVAPGLGTLTLTGFAPTIEGDITVGPATGTLALTGLAPTVLTPPLGWRCRAWVR